MNLKSNFVRGTLLLTFAGVLSRFMGFFYRIFLANTIGAEGIGIYQLIFPIYAICFSLCGSGIETAISKLTAENIALGKPEKAVGILKTGLLLTFFLSLICSLIIYHQAEFISTSFLKEPRSTDLLKFLSFAIPLGSIHACLCGYYYGIHQATVPAISQIIEQSFRMLCVFLLYNILISRYQSLSPSIAVLGLVFGEFAAVLFTFTCYSYRTNQALKPQRQYILSLSKEIYTLAAPLTLSRICINLLASLEAAMIPYTLKTYGLDHATALSIYGVLTGMALPFILFPNTLTSSISLMLLPKISETQAGGQFLTLKTTIKKTFSFCIVLGCFSLLFFLIFGNFLGNFIFSNSLAGSFITILSWICPFLYLNTTLTSVLNGLGLTKTTFFCGIYSIFIRILFIFFGIPKLGIQGYLFGLLFSQLFTTCFSLLKLRITFKKFRIM